MTFETPPDRSGDSRNPAGRGLFRGRRPGSLISSLAGILIVAALVLLLERQAPVLHDILKLIYAVIGVIAFIVIARWFRGRHGKRRVSDRRLADRRDADE